MTATMHLCIKIGTGGRVTEELPDTAAWVSCPYCGTEVQLLVDPGGGSPQEYVEDCEVCCRPWHLHVRWSADGRVEVHARPES